VLIDYKKEIILLLLCI